MIALVMVVVVIVVACASFSLGVHVTNEIWRERR